MAAPPRGVVMKKKGGARFVKPGEIPVGKMITGVIDDVLPSFNSRIKGKLLALKQPNGDIVRFPITGVIGNAIGENPVGEIGKFFMAVRQPDQKSSKYGKNMFMFEVLLSDKKVNSKQKVDKRDLSGDN